MKPGLEARPTQTERIVALLRSRSPAWVPLTELLALRISQYGSRIFTARHSLGLTIESRVETVNGEKRSWFRLLPRKENQPAENNGEITLSPVGDRVKGGSAEISGKAPQAGTSPEPFLFDFRVSHRDQ